MGSKMKRCSTPYVSMEMQIKTTGDHYSSIRMTKIQNPDNIKHCQGYGATGTLTHSLVVGL